MVEPVRPTVVLLPAAKLAVPPGAMFWLVAPPSALRFQPALAAVATLSTAWLVAKSWQPFTASVEVPERRPAATLVMVRSAPGAPTLTVLVGAVPAKL